MSKFTECPADEVIHVGARYAEARREQISVVNAEAVEEMRVSVAEPAADCRKALALAAPDLVSIPHPTEIAGELEASCLRHEVKPGDGLFLASVRLTLANYAEHALRIAQKRLEARATGAPPLVLTDLIRPGDQKPGMPSDLPTAAMATEPSDEAPAFPASEDADFVHDTIRAPSEEEGSIGSGLSSAAHDLGVNPAKKMPI